MKTAVFVFILCVFTIAAMDSPAQRRPFPFGTPGPTPTPSPTPTPTPKVAPCPRLVVQPQGARTVRDGQPVAFAANLSGGDPSVVPMLVWNVSAGTIKDGQGTRRIQVDSTGAGTYPEREIKADLWVGGYAPECNVQHSASIKVIAPATKFGEFGELPAKSVTENLKHLAVFLSQSPDNLYLIGYAGRGSERGYAVAAIRRMKEELMAAGIASRRIMAIDGGFREEPLFDFWIVPQGAQPPRPEPTLRRDEVYSPRAPIRRPSRE